MRSNYNYQIAIVSGIGENLLLHVFSTKLAHMTNWVVYVKGEMTLYKFRKIISESQLNKDQLGKRENYNISLTGCLVTVVRTRLHTDRYEFHHPHIHSPALKVRRIYPRCENEP